MHFNLVKLCYNTNVLIIGSILYERLKNMYLLYFLIWIIFNGNITLEIVLFGLVVSALVFLFSCKCLGYSIEKDIKYSRRALWAIGYVGVLLVEIIKANFIAIKYITTSKYDLEPVVVTFNVNFNSDFSRVLLANSITLTPGTITVSQEGNEFKVHCLDKELAIGLADSVFVKWLTKLEEKEASR